MKAELHCHSIYSTNKRVVVESIERPKDILKYAKRLGCECLAITDHDTIDGIKEAKMHAKKLGILLIPGEEVTTMRGHVLALGIEEEIKPKLSVEETVDMIHKQGGIAIAAHPYDRRRGGVGDLSKKCDAIEVFNALSLERVSNWRAKKFALKNKKPMTAGSDAHCLAMLNHGITNIECESDIDECLKAIKKSRTSVHGEYVPTTIVVDWIVQRLKYSYYYTTNYMKMNYGQPKRWVGTNLIKLVNKSPGNIDYVFRMLGYTALGCLTAYAIFRNVILESIFKF